MNDIPIASTDTFDVEAQQTIPIKSNAIKPSSKRTPIKFVLILTSLLVVAMIGMCYLNQVNENSHINRHLLKEDAAAADDDAVNNKYCIQERLLNPDGSPKTNVITKADIDACGVTELYQFTDTHGGYKWMMKILEDYDIYEDQESKQINLKNAVLVFGGDMIDRGPESIKCLKEYHSIWKAVNVDRTVENSVVFYIEGNHEQYVTSLYEIADEALDLSQTLAYGYDDWIRYNAQPNSPFEYEEIQVTLPGGRNTSLSHIRGARHYYSMDQPMGKWLRSNMLYALMIDNTTIISHAGLTKTFGEELESWRQKNGLGTLMDAFIELQQEHRHFLLGRGNKLGVQMKQYLNPQFGQEAGTTDSPFWSKRYANDVNACAEWRAVKEMFKECAPHLNTIVIGHLKDVTEVVTLEGCPGEVIKTDYHAIDIYRDEWRDGAKGKDGPGRNTTENGIYMYSAELRTE